MSTPRPNLLPIPPLFQPSNNALPVIDPMLKHFGRVWINMKFVEHTDAVRRWSCRDSHQPSLCMLFQRGRCGAGAGCNQAHVNVEHMNAVRATLLTQPFNNCCYEHGDLASQRTPFRALLGQHPVELKHNGSFIPVPPGQIAVTAFWDRHLKAERTPQPGTADRVFRFPLQRVCRLHQSSGCRYGVDCNNVHLCRAFCDTHRLGLGEPQPQPQPGAANFKPPAPATAPAAVPATATAPPAATAPAAALPRQSTLKPTSVPFYPAHLTAPTPPVAPARPTPPAPAAAQDGKPRAPPPPGGPEDEQLTNFMDNFTNLLSYMLISNPADAADAGAKVRPAAPPTAEPDKGVAFDPLGARPPVAEGPGMYLGWTSRLFEDEWGSSPLPGAQARAPYVDPSPGFASPGLLWGPVWGVA